MEWLHVIECEDEDEDEYEYEYEDEDDSDGPNSDRILGSVSLKANCYDSKQQSHRMVALLLST